MGESAACEARGKLGQGGPGDPAGDTATRTSSRPFLLPLRLPLPLRIGVYSARDSPKIDRRNAQFPYWLLVVTILGRRGRWFKSTRPDFTWQRLAIPGCHIGCRFGRRFLAVKPFTRLVQPVHSLPLVARRHPQARLAHPPTRELQIPELIHHKAPESVEGPLWLVRHPRARFRES